MKALSTGLITLFLLTPAHALTTGQYQVYQETWAPTITYFPGAGGISTYVMLWDAPGVLRQQAWLFVSASAEAPILENGVWNGAYTVRKREEYDGSLIFTVLDDNDFFTFTRSAGGYGLMPNQRVGYTFIETPLPSALGLFALGLLALGWRRT